MAAALVLAFGVVAYVSIRRATRPFAHLFEAANQRFQAAGGEAAMPYGSYLDGLGDELIADGAATQDPDHALLRRIATDAQQLKRVIDALPMAVAIHGPDRRPLYVNATYTELLGWRLDDLVGPSTLEFLVPPQEREAYGQMLRELGDPPREVGARFSAACKDGHRIDVQWQFVPLFDRQQRFDGGLTLIHDISKEVAARRRVQALNLRLSVVADAAVNYALIMTDERGRITAWSRGAQALFGGSAAQMRGRGLEQLFDEAQFSARLRLQELIQQALGSDRVDVERRFRRGDGGSFIGRASFYSVGVLGQEGYALIIADVTQEREAALRLAQNESRMAGIIASASDAIISVDVEGRIELFNPAAERIFQIPAAEMLGQPLDRLLPPMARHLHQGHLASFAASKVSRRSMGAGRVEGVRADGQILILEASISQTMAGERSVLTAILRDVTDDRLSADRDRPAS
jgi:PAS domain S-box-containing protein